MSRLARAGQTITIANGATESGAISLSSWCSSVTIQSPGTLPETVNVEIDIDSGGFTPLLSGDSVVTVPANRARIVTNGGFRRLRLVATGAVAADRTFRVGYMVDASQGSV